MLGELGRIDGIDDGMPREGLIVGFLDGSLVGELLGLAVGVTVGLVGVNDGSRVGYTLGR